MKINLYKIAILALALVLGGTSCESPKRYAYLQNVELAKQYAVAYDTQNTIEVGDRLSISVSSTFPELAAPFNGGSMSGGGIAGIGGKLSSTSTDASSQAQGQQVLGYLVETDGSITFPVLGKVSVVGKTLPEVRALLTNLIVDTKYISDPRVEVLRSNYTIYLLGAIGNNGGNTGSASGNSSMYTRISSVQGGRLHVYDKDRVNIFEALSMAGDLPENARISRVNVIRNEGGKYTTYRLDMKSTDIYNSPGFYLKNNDIVYVEPLYRRSESVDRAMQLSGYTFSTITSVVAVIALLRKNN